MIDWLLINCEWWLTAAFQEAIAKYEVVIQNLEFARELQKQFQSIGNDVSPSDCNEIESVWCCWFWLHKPADNVFNGVQSTGQHINHPAIPFFGHLARSNPEEDHHRVITAALRPPSDWRRLASRPRTTWPRTIGMTYSQNFGVHTAWRKAKERDTWHQVVSTATLC